MKTKLIFDVASCHYNDYETIKKIIQECKKMGAYAVKFQLFENSPGNIPIDRDLYKKAIDVGDILEIPIFASIFDEKSFDFYETVKHNSNYIKFAFSQHPLYSILSNIHKLNKYNTILSSDVMNKKVGSLSPYTRLFCIPNQYPVYQEINFEGIFTKHNFDGFSSHCLGYSQDIKAIKSGAKIIEKHICLENSDRCPDAKFALNIEDAKEMMQEIEIVDDDTNSSLKISGDCSTGIKFLSSSEL